MVASLYVQSAEFPTYADYRRAQMREHRKAWKVRNKEQYAISTNARARKRYAEEAGYAEKKSALAKATYEQNPDKIKARIRARAAVLSQTAVWQEQAREYREANKPAARAYKQAWAKKNAPRVNSRTAARRALCAAATPAWVDKQELDDVYAEARHMQMHVDHIIPLNHPLVCGLHVWANLQLLTPIDNMRKNNRFDPETYDAS